MGIEKLGAKIVQKVIAGQPIVKAAQKVAPAVVPEFKSISQIIEKLPKECPACNLSADMLDSISNMRKNLYNLIEKQHGNNSGKIINGYEYYFKEFLESCKNEKVLKDVLSSQEKLIKFVKHRNEVLAHFKGMYFTSFQDKKNFITEFSAIRMYAPDEYKNLINSKTIQEIAQGKLNPSYIEHSKYEDIIQDDFIQNLFNKMESSALVKLKEKGINPDFAIRYISAEKDIIKKSPEQYNKLIEALEKPDKGLANKILSRFPMSRCFMPKNPEKILRTLELSASNPQAVEKALQIKNLDPNALLVYTSMFSSPKELKISEEMFKYFLDFEKKNPHIFNMTLREMNNLMLKTNCDKKFVKQLLDTTISHSSNPHAFTCAAQDISVNNLEYVKQLISKNEFSNETSAKISLSNTEMFKDSKNWDKIDELYKEIMQPLCDSMTKKGYSLPAAIYHSSQIAQMKYTSPELFMQIKDSKLLELLQQGKINPQILEGLGCKCFKLMPEIIEDAQKLAKGESVIKKFDSIKDVIKKTSSGDVISVKGKLYINNNGKLEPWSMSEEKFNELFPLVDRFSVNQAQDDCYLIASMNNIYLNPTSRGAYYKMFEQKGEDIFVTIPAYKEYGGVIKFPNGKIKTDVENRFSSNGSKHIQMIEQAYSRSVFRQGENIPNELNPQITDNLEYLNKRIRGGHFERVMSEFEEIFGKKGTTKRINIESDNRKDVEKILTDYANNPRYIVNEGYGQGLGMSGHARSVRSYNPQTKSVTIIDPSVAGVQTEISLTDFVKRLLQLSITRVA